MPSGCASSYSWKYSGTTGSPLNAVATPSPASVIVGVEVYYTDASSNASGAVLGLSKIFCAAAENVFWGDNTSTTTVDFGFKPPEVPTAMKHGILQPPRGAYALDGFQIAYSVDGATRLACTYRTFAQGVDESARQLTDYFPENNTAAATTALVACCTKGQDLYLQALEEAFTTLPFVQPSFDFVARLGGLTIKCADYATFFQTIPSDKKIACCRGEKWFMCGGYAPQTAKCDQTMATYCASLCTGGACADPVCGCLGSPLAGDAACFDARCADSPEAYRTADASAICRGKILTCAQWNALGRGRFVATGVAQPLGCDPPSGKNKLWEWLKQNPLALGVMVLFLVLIVVIALESSQPNRKRLPPGALPQLPALSEL